MIGWMIDDDDERYNGGEGYEYEMPRNFFLHLHTTRKYRRHFTIPFSDAGHFTKETRLVTFSSAFEFLTVFLSFLFTAQNKPTSIFHTKHHYFPWIGVFLYGSRYRDLFVLLLLSPAHQSVSSHHHITSYHITLLSLVFLSNFSLSLSRVLGYGKGGCGAGSFLLDPETWVFAFFVFFVCAVEISSIVYSQSIIAV